MSEGLLLQRSTEADLICRGQMVSFTRSGDPKRGDLMKEVMVRGCKKPVGLHHILCRIFLSETGETPRRLLIHDSGFCTVFKILKGRRVRLIAAENTRISYKNTSCSVLYVNSWGEYVDMLHFFSLNHFFYLKFWCL